MRVVWFRRFSQAVFFSVFLFFCLVSSPGEQWYRLGSTLGPPKWPISWFFEADPLLAISQIFAKGDLPSGFVWALAVLAFTALLGRFFCGFVCPFGALNQAVGFLISGLRRRVLPLKYHRLQSLKYYLLAFFLVTSFLGQAISLSRTGQDYAVGWLFFGLVLLGLLAFALQSRGSMRTNIALIIALTLLWLFLGRIVQGDEILDSSLLAGLLDPMTLAYRSFAFFVLPFLDRGFGVLYGSPYHHGAWLIGGLFLLFLFLNIVTPRFFCRFLCPLGALFGLLAHYAPLRIYKRAELCTDCQRCNAVCEGACEPVGTFRRAECLLCLNCLAKCPEKAVTYGLRPLANEAFGPTITRRGLVTSAFLGLAGVPLLRLGGLVGPDWRPYLLRPPGSQPEPDFLRLCIRCGQCIRVCPSGVLQPAGLEAGFEAIFTPVLNNRLGTSGCQTNCTLCGQVCPTGAIRKLSLDEKLGRGEFAHQGPVKIGTAFIDRGRCLPWAFDRPCIVCQENCPTSPKAIFLRSSVRKDREGRASKIDRPYVDPRYCTGCGICEHVCPIRGIAAIRVSAENETRSQHKSFWIR